MSELRKIPNVGPATERDLLAMGYASAEDLKGKSAEELYAEECALRGFQLDRCQLYLYRAVSYFVNTDRPDPEKCKWWYWKDEFATPSPCGAICAECGRFPSDCAGCRKIGGKPWWLAFTGQEVCAVYDCCARSGRPHCGGCSSLPCERFTSDPTLSEAENAAHLRIMLRNLEGADSRSR